MKKNKPIHIHFVCQGNGYRSRLAEMYLKSLKIHWIKASSSGLEEKKCKYLNGPLCWYAGRLALKYNLMKFISFQSTQTTIRHLTSVDLVIFMHPDNYSMFERKYSLTLKKFTVWDIPDLHHFGFTGPPKNIQEDIKYIKATEKTYQQITSRIDELVKKLALSTKTHDEILSIPNIRDSIRKGLN